MTPEIVQGAGSISSLVLLYLEKESTGYIHSIFRKSLNIRFGKNLIFISGQERSLVSFGCCIPDDKIRSILSVAEIDDVVVRKDTSLIFYTKSGIETIDLGCLEIMELKIPHIENKKKVLMGIMNELKNIDFSDRIGLEDKRSSIMERLENGIIEENQKYLTGRGKGLTPSGDDILVGYAFVCHLCGESPFLTYGNRTTDISRQYFDAVNRGYFNENLLKLLGNEARKAVSEICETGHTSGYDMLFGIFTGIKNKLLKMEEIL